jgi:hypothetical protein
VTLSFNDIISFKALQKPVIFLIGIGLLYLLPQNEIFLAIMSGLLLFYCYNNPIRTLYVSTALISCRYFFVNNGAMIGSDFEIFAPWRFLQEKALLMQSSDKIVFFLLLINILLINFKNKDNLNFRRFNYSLTILICIFVFITIMSMIANSISLFNTLFFIQMFTKPVLFLILILQMNWKKKEIFDFFKFVFAIILLMQIIPTFVENTPQIVRGYIFFVDQFTGTFTYGGNYSTTQFLIYACCILFINYLQIPNIKSLFWFIACLFCIISAQSGFQTAIIFLFICPWVISVFINSGNSDIKTFTTLFKFLYIIITLLLLNYLILNVTGLRGIGYVYEYSESITDVSLNEGIFELPKFRTYNILYDYWAKGEISPILGIGPCGYLSGAAFYAGSKYYTELIANKLYFRSSFRSNVLTFPQNSTVGIIGEVGIFGYIVYIILYFMPFVFIKRNLKRYFKTFWSPVAVGYVGIFISLISWSFFWNAFEDIALSGVFFIISGILMQVFLLLTNNEEPENEWT